MKMRNLIALVLVAILTFGGSTALADAVSEKVADAAPNGKTIEIWTRGNETDTHGPAFIEALKSFEKKTGVTVKYQFIPHSDAVTKWNAAFASSTAPDVMDVGIVHIVERVNLGHIVPMNQYVETWEGKDDIYPAMLELGSMNDNVYAIAHNPDAQVFAYRKDMFEEAGLDPNRPPQNWDELLEYSEKLATFDAAGNVERTGLTVPTSGARFLASVLVRQNGGHFADEALNVPTMTSPEAIETVEYINKLHKFSSLYDNNKGDSNPLLLNSAAMGYLANGSMSGYLKANPDMVDKFGFTDCVPGKQRAAWSGMWFYAMTSQAEDPDLAWQLIAYMTSPEVLSRRVELTGLPTAYASTSAQYVELNPTFNQAVVDAIACGAGNPKVSWAINYELELDAALEEVFYGVSTPEQALEKAQSNLMKELS